MQLSKHDILLLCSIAGEAGQCIMPYFRKEHHARHKEDHSPVTDADMAAHEHILAGLKRHFSSIPVISEEDTSLPEETPGRCFFLVDPLDGTKSFVRGEGEFTVNIGLVEGDRPVYGIMVAPVTETLYHGGRGQGAFCGDKPIRCRPAPPEGLVVTRSLSHPSPHTASYLAGLSIQEIRPASSSVKFGWVAEGSADLYPRFGRTMEWDTCAGQAILEGAGGSVITEEGEPLLYGKKGFENPAFIAHGLTAAEE